MLCLTTLPTALSFHIMAGRDDGVGAPVSWGLDGETAEEVS